MKKNKLVSVILTSYNSYSFLSNAIKSVLNQTYDNLELIIVDDCSTDNTIKIIKKFIQKDKRVRLYSSKFNSGNASLPRNLGISKAKGSYISFLDADDVWDKNKLFYQMKSIGNNKFSFTSANYQKENSLKKSNFIVTYFRIFLQILFIFLIKKRGYYYLYIYNPFLISSALVHRKVFTHTIFDFDTNKREDLTFWLEIIQKSKKKIIFHPKVLLTITRRKHSLTSNKVEELNKIINSICFNFLKNRNFEKYNYFLIGIIFRVTKMFLSKVYLKLRGIAKILSILSIILYFLIFYSPLFWIVGENLIYHNDQKKTEAVFVLSGHQGFEYWNQSYQYRYFDSMHYLKKYDGKNDTKFILLGKLTAIPEQKILESLMIASSVKKENIKIIYEEYKNSKHAIELLINYLKINNIKSITIITSPYHSLRVRNIWNSISSDKFDVVFFKHYTLPKKNSFFEKSFNKNEIIYEILANIKFKIFSK